MSTYTSEPGTRLAGRYRLVDRVGSGSGWTLWKAIDETLARPVTVLTFAPGFPRIPEVITAARAASRLTDSRLAQVFDVEDAGDQAYVVMEWVAGDTLTDLLADGPLDPGRAVALVVEASQALAAAHASGQAHLRLTPGSLRWTRSSGAKITGLGIDAALAGHALTEAAASDPALTDTIGLARLLYAALTGYWPGDEPQSLPPAPVIDGAVCTPRQVTAAVPAPVDAVTAQALLQRQTRHGGPITTPSAFADALGAVAPPVPLPDPAPRPAPQRQDGHRRTENNYASGGYRGSGYSSTQPSPAISNWGAQAGGHGHGRATTYRRKYPATERSVATRAMISVVIVLVLAAVGLTAWVISNGVHSPQHSAGAPQKGNGGPSTAANLVLKPVSAHSFDVYGSGGDHDHDALASRAIDGNPNTFWSTDYYLNYPTFGNLKPGTGLILDMGKDVTLSQVQVLFGASCCAHVRLEIGNQNTLSPAALQSFTTVATTRAAVGSYTFATNSTASGRYVLLWFTSLPPLAGNPHEYEAQVYNVVVRGTVSSGSG